LLAGVPPHSGETALAVALHHLNTPPPRLETVSANVPSSFARVVHRMMAKRPEQRFQSASELLAELRNLAAQAASEGWGEGPQGWSLAEWTSTGDPQRRATIELKQLMEQNSKLERRPVRPSRAAMVVAAALIAGGVAGVVFRPRTYLAGSPSAPVERRATVWAQLFQANTAPSEAAWRAVRQNFPNEDPFVQALADAGLARYYLFLERDFPKALAPLRDVMGSSAAAAADSPLRSFAEAGLCIAHQRLGHTDEARTAASHLTSDMRDHLRRSETRLYELLQSSLRALGE
jgi:serine/threonine-protein kinase